jgi:hypothetical protein
MTEKKVEKKAVYVKPVVLAMEDVFTQVVPFADSYCYTSSGR